MAEPTRAADGKFTKPADGGTAVLDAPKTEEISKEGLEGLQLLKDNLMGRKPADKKADDETVETPEEKEQAAAKAKADTDAKAKAAADKKRKAAPVKRAEPEPLTADAIGEAVAKRLQPKVEPKKEEAKPDLEAGLDDEEKETLGVLREMETLYPDRYKAGTLTARYAEGQRKLNEYAAKWRKDNAGQEFDLSAPEHSEFLDKNDVDWPERDFKAAERSLLRKELKGEVKSEVVKELEPQLSEIEKFKQEKEQSKKLEKEQGAIRATQVDRIRNYWSGIGDEYKDLMGADGIVDNEAWTAMHEADPQKAVVIVDTSYALRDEVAEAKKLFDSVVNFDKSNMVHNELYRLLNKYEAERLADPEDQIDEQGRKLISFAAFSKLPESEKSKHWLFGRDELLDELVAERTAIAKRAAAIVERGTITGSEVIAFIKEGNGWVVDSIEKAFKQPKKGAQIEKPATELARPAVQPTPPKGFTFRNGVNPKPNSPGSTGDSKLAAHTRANGNSGKNDDPTSLKAFMRR